jgi:hypothetical protein
MPLVEQATINTGEVLFSLSAGGSINENLSFDSIVIWILPEDATRRF